MTSGTVLIRTRPFWLAWYPLRGKRCQFGRDEVDADFGGWHFSAALGPLYLGVGTGRPLP